MLKPDTPFPPSPSSEGEGRGGGDVKSFGYQAFLQRQLAAKTPRLTAVDVLRPSHPLLNPPALQRGRRSGRSRRTGQRTRIMCNATPS